MYVTDLEESIFSYFNTRVCVVSADGEVLVMEN